jgi:hypothetical protein
MLSLSYRDYPWLSVKFFQNEAILMQNRRKSERKRWPLGALGDFET